MEIMMTKDEIIDMVEVLRKELETYLKQFNFEESIKDKREFEEKMLLCFRVFMLETFHLGKLPENVNVLVLENVYFPTAKMECFRYAYEGYKKYPNAAGFFLNFADNFERMTDFCANGK